MQRALPRVRGFCGNPLIRPKAVSTKVVYVGNRWADFNLTKITVIQSSTVIVKSLKVVNISAINTRVDNRVYINMPCFYQLITIWFLPPRSPDAGHRRHRSITGHRRRSSRRRNSSSRRPRATTRHRRRAVPHPRARTTASGDDAATGTADAGATAAASHHRAAGEKARRTRRVIGN